MTVLGKNTNTLEGLDNEIFLFLVPPVLLISLSLLF